MSYRFSFDLDTASVGSDDRRRINLAFESFGWESVGGTSWRYPALGMHDGPDDYFGQVQPALWYFFSLVAAKGIEVTKYSLDAHSESYYREKDSIGHAILPVAKLGMLIPEGSTQSKLSGKRLRRVLEASELALT
jgi:hypothetical protein